MTPLDDAPETPRRSRAIHDFKNQLGIVIGFSDLLLAEMASDDARRDDIEEIHKAGLKALALLDDVVATADRPPDSQD